MRRGIVRLGFVVTLVGIVLFALGGSALAAPPTLGETGQNGPTNVAPFTGPKLGDPVATQSEVQWITVTITGANPTGTYQLTATDATYGGPTGNIKFDAPATGYSATYSPFSVQLALAGQTASGTSPAVAGIYAVGTVTVVGGPSSVDYNSNGVLTGGSDGKYFYRVTWVGTEAGNNKGELSVTGSTLSGVTVAIETYRNGQVFETRLQPHGGYSASTDYCVQCHSVHGASDEYALLAGTSVTQTCATCHSLFGGAPSGALPGGNPTVPSAPTSERAAYEINPSGIGHGLGSQLSGGIFSTKTLTLSGWGYSSGPIKDTDPAGGLGNSSSWNSSEIEDPGLPDSGLYCGDCHTPHGDFGQLVNSKFYRSSATGQTGNDGSSNLSAVQTLQEDAPFFVGRTKNFLHFDSARNVWQACPTTTDDTKCVDWTMSDTEGESAYGYGYKLLSAYPNHSWSSGPESFNMDASGHDGARWCGRCHDLATPSAYGGTAHSHPTGCTACHGNPNNGTSTDFPHTSTFTNLLKDYPDLLCINCHSAGNLP